ncbi:aldehyde dehydrogenase family protein [Halieaceae bacterium IMCC14734]|uniref:Aldehyde dehydrogenase family protein n=1 Tax=Candidatus Litorirhabdus singularis TaxID=2518993 RepID=A0ABT3TDJ0_9GAMM|nr:aldehyde dehydrogenase family protein [Candidatus Litorirhabdus singularis]MCX2980343.1 aldehyde dehydrogenase family protein [Candidatus Litorirhabdus singularis]
MNPETRLFIDGELVTAASGATYPNINPATEAVIGEVADAGTADMERAIAAARRAFDETDWSTNHAFRHHCLQQLQAGLRAVQDDFKQQISAETGAPMGICGGSGPQCEVPISMMDFTLETLPDFQWSRDLGIAEPLGQRSRRLVEKEAIGVVAAVTPWNVPLQINLAKCVPALAAGCTVVLKAAPDTPWSATMLGRVVKEHTDIPAGVFNVITAADPVAVGEQLVTDPRVDMVSFTGSTAVGKHIMSQAADSVKKVFLELGGKSANIILDDADLGSALLSSLAVCFHAGQGCAIMTRLLVPRSKQQEVEELLKTYFGFIQYGDPAAEDQIMGPVVNQRQYERVLAYIERGKNEGARLLLGGGTPAHLSKGYYIEPTVFVDVTNDMTIAQEEIFGPVLCVITYEDEEDAIRIANDSPYGLSGGVQSASDERALAVARRIRTGTLMVNGGNYYAADAPFGGYKQSGIGREMGPEGFEEYLETKTIAIGA